MFKEKTFAEFWMGDHVNGPSHVVIDENSSMQIGTNPKFAERKQEDK
jgi:mannose-6-phosphate isomerase class I